MQEVQETKVPSLGGKTPWRRKWQPTSVFLPGKSHGQRSLAGYNPWGLKESDRTERAHVHAENKNISRLAIGSNKPNNYFLFHFELNTSQLADSKMGHVSTKKSICRPYSREQSVNMESFGQKEL